jgi:hypothetical protein
MEFLLKITADFNDGDYCHQDSEVDESTLQKIKSIISTLHNKGHNYEEWFYKLEDADKDFIAEFLPTPTSDGDEIHTIKIITAEVLNPNPKEILFKQTLR